MSAAHKGLAQASGNRAVSYTQLGKRDTAKLVSILRDSPLPCDAVNSEKTQQYLKRVKKAMQRLPPHLLGSNWKLAFGNVLMPKTSEVSRGGLCHALHARFSAKAIHSVFNWVKHEFDTGIPNFLYPLYHHNGLTPEQEKFMRYIELVSEMWRDDWNPRAKAPPGREPIYSQVQQDGIIFSRWAKGTNTCPACMLARIGGSFRACYALLLGMLARTPTASIKKGSRRIRWVEAWVNQFSQYPETDRSFVIWAWNEATKMKEFSHSIKEKIKAGKLEDPSIRPPMFPTGFESTCVLPSRQSLDSPTTPVYANGGIPNSPIDDPFAAPFDSPPASPRPSTGRASIDSQSEAHHVNHTDHAQGLGVQVEDSGEKPPVQKFNPWFWDNTANYPPPESIYSEDTRGASAAAANEGVPSLSGKDRAEYAASYIASLGAIEEAPKEGNAPESTRPLFARDAWANYNGDDENNEAVGMSDKEKRKAWEPTSYDSVFQGTLDRAQSSRSGSNERPDIPARSPDRGVSVRPLKIEKKKPTPSTASRNLFEFYDDEPSPVLPPAPAQKITSRRSQTVPGPRYEEAMQPTSPTTVRSGSPPLPQFAANPNWIRDGIHEGFVSGRASVATTATEWDNFLPQETTEKGKATLPNLRPLPRSFVNPMNMKFSFGKGKKTGDK